MKKLSEIEIPANPERDLEATKQSLNQINQTLLDCTPFISRKDLAKTLVVMTGSFRKLAWLYEEKDRQNKKLKEN